MTRLAAIVPLLVIVERVNLHWPLSVGYRAPGGPGKKPCWSFWKSGPGKAEVKVGRGP